MKLNKAKIKEYIEINGWTIVIITIFLVTLIAGRF